MPERVRMRRTRGWRKPPGVVVCTRATKYGNPYKVVHAPRDISSVTVRALLVALYERDLDAGRLVWRGQRITKDMLRSELAGRDLGCTCPLDEPCHVDVILRVANEVGT